MEATAFLRLKCGNISGTSKSFRQFTNLGKETEGMRRVLLVLSLLFVISLFIGCGERPSAVTNASSSTNAANANNTGTGATAGTGPQNQGIGGSTTNGAVSSNTYTVPPGFNKNGDRGSASTTSNTP